MLTECPRCGAHVQLTGEGMMRVHFTPGYGRVRCEPWPAGKNGGSSNPPKPHKAPDPIPAEPDRILKLKEVSEMTSLARSTIYNYIQEGTFPRGVNLGKDRRVGWRLSDIQKWIRDLEPVELQSQQSVE